MTNEKPNQMVNAMCHIVAAIADPKVLESLIDVVSCLKENWEQKADLPYLSPDEAKFIDRVICERLDTVEAEAAECAEPESPNDLYEALEAQDNERHEAGGEW